MNTLEQVTRDLNAWQPLKKFVEIYPQFTMNQLRWLIFNKEANGMDKCTTKIGKKIYINSDLFCQFMDEH